MTGPATGQPSAPLEAGRRGLDGRSAATAPPAGAAAWAAAILRGERRALGGEAVRLGDERRPDPPSPRRAPAPCPARCDERVAARDDPVARLRAAPRSGRRSAPRARRVAASPVRSSPRVRSSSCRAWSSARGDPLVLAPDPVQQVVVVEQLRERLGAEREADDVGVLGLVDRPQMALEHARARTSYWRCRTSEARRLARRSSSRAPASLRPLRREGGLERLEPSLLGGDRRLGARARGRRSRSAPSTARPRTASPVGPVAQLADPARRAAPFACRDRPRRRPADEHVARTRACARAMTSGHESAFAPPPASPSRADESSARAPRPPRAAAARSRPGSPRR